LCRFFLALGLRVGCGHSTQPHRIVAALVDPKLGVIAHREGSHQLVAIEDQVGQSLPVSLCNGTELVRPGAAPTPLFAMSALAHDSSLLLLQRSQYTQTRQRRKELA
jgi:hypothetical protein